MKKVDMVKRLSPVGKFPETFAAIWDGIDEELKERLTARELALVIYSNGQSYIKGQADAGAWVEGDVLGVGDTIIPLAIIKSIIKKQKIEEEYSPVTLQTGESPLQNYRYMPGLHLYFKNNDKYEEIEMAGYYGVIEAGEAYLRNNPDGKLYTRQTWYVDEYYIGDQLIYKERI